MNGSALQNIIAGVGTVLTGLLGGLGGIQLLRKIQKNYLDTADKRYLQQETKIAEQAREIEKKNAFERQWREADIDRMELARVIESIGGTVPPHIKSNIERSDGT